MTTANGDTSAGIQGVPALSFRGVDFRYGPEGPLAVAGLDLELWPGEFCALVGGNGSGKTTLARLANGLLLPQEGEVAVEGLRTDSADARWEVRRRVGLLFQDPEEQIVGASVEDDVAFGLENLGVPREIMRKRVDAIIARVGLAGEEHREPHLLSGGQKQRLALASVLVLRPSVLVLDEPTSMLDPAGRDEVLGFVHELAASGIAVLMITQHMAETLSADRLVYLERGTKAYDGSPARFFRSGRHRGTALSPPAPAMLARYLAAELRVEKESPGGEEAIPLTEDEMVTWLGSAMADRAAAFTGDAHAGTGRLVRSSPGRETGAGGYAELGDPRAPGEDRETAVSLSAVDLVYAAGLPHERTALADIAVRIPRGAVVAVVGPTASGKSTLLQVMAGLLAPSAGEVSFFGSPKPGRGVVGMAFQRPETQLFAATVREDVAMAPRLAGVEGDALEKRVREALEVVGLDADDFGPRSPHSLSLGEQRRTAIAGVLSLDPPLLILDEPGAGLDPRGRRALLARLLAWARRPAGNRGPAAASASGRTGRTLVLTSHDLDEVAEAVDLVLVLSDGRLLAAGGVEILSDSTFLGAAGLRPPLVTRLAEGLGLPGERLPVRASALVERLLAREVR